jgi:hypothetical protein
MGKVFGILFVVVSIWVVMEVYSEGTNNAFGGALVSAGLVDAESGESGQSKIRRTGTKVNNAHAEADARRNRLLAE